jgi:hypothetical protein
MSVRKKRNDMKKAAAAAALARGEKDFYLSWPCVNGHRGPWNSKTERCRKCRAATQARANAKHAKTAKGKATRAKADAKHAKTAKGKATRARANAKHAKTAKGKATRARANAKYAKTAKGKATQARANAKRAKTGRRLRKHKAYRASPTGQFDSMVGEVLDMADADLSDVDRKEI